MATDKINAAYSFGGPKLLAETVQNVTGLHIDHYMGIGFGGFVRVVNAVGGVRMCLKAPLVDPAAGLHLHKGCQVLNGAEALGFVRSRHNYATQDLQRIQNQRLFLRALLRKLTSAGVLANPFAALPAASGLAGTLTVDRGTHLSQLLKVAFALRNPITTTVPIANPGYVTPTGEDAVLWNRSAALQLFRDLRTDHPLAQEPDHRIQAERLTRPHADAARARFRAVSAGLQATFSQKADNGEMTTASGERQQPTAKLLVVEDEPNILELLAASLRYAGFEVVTAAAGSEAVQAAQRHRPDLIVLDVMLPDMDGFDVLHRLRGGGTRTPVVFLTARDSTEDKVRGLTLGGDDYVTKPFSLEEVIARIQAVLRRTRGGAAEPSPRLAFADLELDEDSHEVWRNGTQVQLSPTEFKLLRYFMRNAGRVLSKMQILDHVWDYDFRGDTGIVESYVSVLRRKIDATEPHLLHTLRGVGYVMRLPSS